MMKAIRPGFKRVVDLDRRTPDEKHDTRILECGHSVIVPKMTLHPVTTFCKACQEKIQ